jgi:hypothetical protein
MHTYRKNKDGDHTLWTVGHWQPAGTGDQKWWALKDFAREEDAADYCSYLNGGRRP